MKRRSVWLVAALAALALALPSAAATGAAEPAGAVAGTVPHDTRTWDGRSFAVIAD